jgi:hypothetical protein
MPIYVIEAIAPLVGGALVSGGLSLLGGLFGNNSAKKEAVKNREFQERMARNAHQYEVEDLKKAGLNPILSGLGGSGASTPSGAVANVKDPISPAVSTALQARMNQGNLELLEKQTKKTDAEAFQAETSADNAWKTNNLLWDEPMSQIVKKVQAGHATPAEMKLYTDYEIQLRTAHNLNVTSALAEQQTRNAQQQERLNKPEEEFNRQTGNSATWFKNIIQGIKAIK